MICTQVVAIMPPKSTYSSITTPTIADRRFVRDAEHQP